MSKDFPKPFRSFGGNIKVEVDLSNYGTKTDLKNVTHNDTSGFTMKTNLTICLIMQQKQILKIFHTLILQVLH